MKILFDKVISDAEALLAIEKLTEPLLPSPTTTLFTKLKELSS